jgi:hypothetical protein
MGANDDKLVSIFLILSRKNPYSFLYPGKPKIKKLAFMKWGVLVSTCRGNYLSTIVLSVFVFFLSIFG